MFQIRILQGLRVVRDGVERPLPNSRKTRALLALLACEPRVHRRQTLCDLLWPETADPRAGLRWSLSKLREVLALDGGSCVVGDRDGVRLDWQKVSCDVVELAELLEDADADTALLQQYVHAIDPDGLRDLGAGTSTEFELWLESQGENIRRLYQRLLSELMVRLHDSPREQLAIARLCLANDPLNLESNVQLLTLVAEQEGRREAQAVLENMRKRFQQAGLPDHDLVAAWRGVSGPAVAHIVDHPSTADAPPVLPQKPSVAVLGFDDLGGHAGGDVLAQGLAVDINSRLAQLSGLFVIAHASASRFSLREADAMSISQRLGVRYLIHGSTRRLDQRLRVTVELIDAGAGANIWSDHFDRPLDDMFLVQDDITNAIVAAVEPEIERAEMERCRLTATENLDAWECYHRAMWHGFRFTAKDNAAATALLQRALQQDPRFARAHAALSFTHFSRAFLDASDDPADDVRQALHLARQSVSLDVRDAMGHWALGRGLFLSKQHDEALAAINRSLAANPNFAQGRYARGFVGVHAGAVDQALPDLQMAQRLSPFDPLLFAMKSSRAIGLAVEGRVDEAAAWSMQATFEPNAHFHIYAIAAACLELAGRSDEARKHMNRALDRHPKYTIAVFERSFPHRLERHRTLMSDALLRAGLPRE